MNAVIYRAKGKNGYIYDKSINPLMDFVILKRTRNIEKIEVVTPEIPFELAEIILKSIYGTSLLIEKLIPSDDFLIKKTLKKHKIVKKSQNILQGGIAPSNENISKVEEYIKGRIISLNKLINMKETLKVSETDILNIVQCLYCERRIKMVPAVKKTKKGFVCSFCDKLPCDVCCMGFDTDDILLYAADNYNTGYPRLLNINKKTMTLPYKETYENVLSFVKSKKDNAILWSVPYSYDDYVLAGGIESIIKNGGKILYVTSTEKSVETMNALKNIIKGARIVEDSSGIKSIKDIDIYICSYKFYPCFYKAFDLVIVNLMDSFMEKPLNNVDFLCRKAVKEKGKIITITPGPELARIKFLKNYPEIIPLALSKSKNPIPEPMFVKSRFISGNDPFIPPIVTDMIKWSIGEGIGVMIFTTDNEKAEKLHYYLVSNENIENSNIDISSVHDKTALLRFKKKEVMVIVTTDTCDAKYPIENVNVIVMNSDSSCYSINSLIYISALASYHKNKKLGEAVFVSSSETEIMNLAKDRIREINKIAWEKGYMKQ